MLSIRTKLVRENASLPTYGTAFSAGADLYACLEETVTVHPHETKLIPIGIAMEIPVGWAGFVYARSGLALKRHLAPANKVGVIDCDYRGEIFVPMHNHSESDQIIEPGERIAQMIFAPYYTANFVEAAELSETVRSEKGFGSTGTK